MSDRTFTAGDWIAAASAQAKACRAANGVQSTAGGGSYPYTPGQFAIETIRFWTDHYPAVLLAAKGEGKPIPGDALGEKDGLRAALIAAEQAPEGSGWFTFLDGLGVSDSPASTQGVRAALKRVGKSMFALHDAVARGSIPGTHNPEGRFCLHAEHSPRFWESTKLLGLDYSFLAARTSIPGDEYWTAVKEGAKDGLRDVGEAVGATTGAIGEGLGSAVGGLFNGLGVVNTALVLGGGYLVATKVY